MPLNEKYLSRYDVGDLGSNPSGVKKKNGYVFGIWMIGFTQTSGVVI